MRQIKFRALYDDMGGGWKYGMLIYEGDVPRIQQAGTMLFSTCLKGTEGQFTGLLDKNGKEIWEGDICDRYHLRGVVVYHEERAMFILKDGFNEPLYTEILGVEAIGNIYENPELTTSPTGE